MFSKCTLVAFGLAAIVMVARCADDDAGVPQLGVVKRRGWGKRASPDSDSLPEGEPRLDKRRGWGKRGWGKRGWGKRYFDLEEMTKRSPLTPLQHQQQQQQQQQRQLQLAAFVEPISDIVASSVGGEQRTGNEMSKRRGWGKRSFDYTDSSCGRFNEMMLYHINRAVQVCRFANSI